MKRSKFALASLPLGCLALPWTTPFTTLVSATVECDTTDTQALGRLLRALVTDCRRGCPPTTAGD